MEGVNAVYKCEVWGSVPNGIPAEELTTGKKFSVETAYVERALSRKVGDRLSYVTLQLIAA